MKKNILRALPWLCLCLNFGCATSRNLTTDVPAYQVTGNYWDKVDAPETEIIILAENDFRLNRAKAQLIESGLIIKDIKRIIKR